MKNNQWLMIDTIKIGVLYALVLCSGISAMDLSVVKKNTTQALTFKSLKGLPCFNVKEINKLWAKMPERKKQKITQLINGSNDERIITLFNVATQLPSELHSRIASWLFKGSSESTEFFLQKPLYCLDRCIFSQEIMKGAQLTSFVRTVALRSKSLKRVCGIKTIFELFDDIIVVDNVLQQSPNEWPTCSRKELAAFWQVLQSFPQMSKKLSFFYVYRDAYTPSNVLKSISVPQLCGVVMLTMPVISALIMENFSHKALMDNLVEQNRCSVIKNDALRAAFQETGELFLLQDLSEIVDPWQYSDFDFVKAISPNLLTGWICFAIREMDMNELLAFLKDNKLGAFFLTISGLFSLAVVALFYRLLTYNDSSFNEDLMIYCGFLDSYIVGCFAYNLAYMYVKKKSTVKLKDISDLLHNKNIVIQ